MIAVIIGATGLVGSLLLEKLLMDPEIHRVISISRRRIHKTSGHQQDKLKEVLVSDLSELAARKSEMQGDLYFCCLGTTIKKAGSQESFRRVDYLAVVEFGKIAQTHQAKSLTVISASGANSQSLIFYNRVKGETEAALRDLHLQRLVIFRPGLLIGERKEFRMTEKIFTNLYKVLTPILPPSFQAAVATSAVVLASRMLAEGKRISPALEVIEARAI